MMDNVFSTAWLRDFEEQLEAVLFPSVSSSESIPSWRSAAQQYMPKKRRCHLFVCCNYNPDPRSGSPAADYKTAVLNLYRFVRDTGPVVNSWSWICYGDTRPRSSRDFLRDRDQVDLLRAMAAHNNSAENGLFEAAQLESYEKWCMNVIGKAKPAADSDYISLTDEVCKLSDRICDHLKKGLTYMEGLSPEARLVCIRRWENEILDFFTGDGIKSDTIRGFLIAAYCDEKGLDYPNSRSKFNQYKRESTQWLYERYFHEERIRELESYYAMKGSTKQLIKETLTKLQNERNQWVTAARAQLGSSADDSAVDQKMEELCETDFFKTGLKAYWALQLGTGSPLPSMLPKSLLSKYVDYKLKTEGARVPPEI